MRASFLAEPVEAHDLAASGWLLRIIVGCRRRRFAGRLWHGGDRWSRARLLGLGGRLRFESALRLTRRGGCGRPRGNGRGTFNDLLELDAKGNRWIDELLDRGEGHGEPLRDAAERHTNLEARVADDQIPELVLQNDRHRVGKLSEQS